MSVVTPTEMEIKNMKETTARAKKKRTVFQGWKQVNNSGVSGTYERDGWTICYTVGWEITRPDGFKYAYHPEQMKTAVQFAEKHMKSKV